MIVVEGTPRSLAVLAAARVHQVPIVVAGMPERIDEAQQGLSPKRQSAICCTQRAGAVPRLRHHWDGQLIVVRTSIAVSSRTAQSKMQRHAPFVGIDDVESHPRQDLLHGLEIEPGPGDVGPLLVLLLE